MPLYGFKCEACGAERTLVLPVDETIKVGTVVVFAPEQINEEEDCFCSCGANAWRRIWGRPPVSKFNTRRTSIV